MILKTAIKLSFFIIISIPIYSQENDEAPNNLILKNYWGISLTPLLTAKAKIEGDKNKYRLHSLPQFGAEVLINYYFNFKQNHSLIFSAGGNVLAYNFNYDIPKEMFDPPLGYNPSSNKALSRESGIFNFKAQVELQRKWRNDLKKNWDAGAGLSLLYSVVHPIDISELFLDANGQTKEYLTRTNEYNNNGKPWFNFHISGGHEWILKSQNIFQVNLKLNYSPTTFANATYRFNVGNQPEVSGNYLISGSYIGLCISYVFARSKKG